MRTIVLIFILAFICTLSVSSSFAQNLIFEENFDDGFADGFFPDSVLWHVNDSGQYEIENWGFEISSHSYFGEYWWTDFYLSLDMLTQDSVLNSVGFRIQENGDRYIVALRGEPYKDVFLFKTINGTQHELITAEFSNTWTNWHHLEVTASGNHLLFHVNGELALEYTDSNAPYLNGRQSLLSYTGGVAQHQLLLVDNIEVFNPVVSAESTSLDHLKTLFR